MESSSKKSCSFDEKEYSHDSEVCDSDTCRKCNDGQWELSSRESDDVCCC